MSVKVEICANNFESAKAAQEGGAHRIELCAELSVGGLTPSYGLIAKVISELKISSHVLIRPRSGDFNYSESELDVMLRDIALCKQLGCRGIVSGVLNSECQINEAATKRLMEASEGMEFTFHRAFDCVRNPKKALKTLLHLKVKRLLTSGLELKAIDGIKLLIQLKDLSEKRMEIMPGSGIDLSNVLAFKDAGFESVHLSATKKIAKDYSSKASQYFGEDVQLVSDVEIIRKLVKKFQ